ncbi:amidohydrolase family protein, partial [Leucobacter sp. M11]|uniref:amidohydrolase family protein n=1 Tax=Leucobacter sp. M11 TaxID=2993565 RepID=UPI002D80DC64
MSPTAEVPESRIIHSARRIDAGGLLEDAWVLSRSGHIVGSGTGDGWRSHTADSPEVIDAAGRTLVPGFIDLHAHGAGGAAYDDGPTAMRRALAAHRAHGTTRAVLSFVASPVPALIERLGEVAALAEQDPGVLGAHLEGPFLADQRRGAHDPAQLIAPDPETVQRLMDAGRGLLRQVTLAPEREGALDAIARFS